MVGRLRERIKRLLPMMGGLDQRDTQALEELLRLALERGDIQAGTARQAVKWVQGHRRGHGHGQGHGHAQRQGWAHEMGAWLRYRAQR